MTYRLANKTTYPEAPKGKRTARQNIYGNVVAYVGGKRFWEFGSYTTASDDADLFVKGYSLSDIMDGTAGHAEGLF